MFTTGEVPNKYIAGELHRLRLQKTQPWPPSEEWEQQRQLRGRAWVALSIYLRLFACVCPRCGGGFGGGVRGTTYRERRRSARARADLGRHRCAHTTESGREGPGNNAGSSVPARDRGVPPADARVRACVCRGT